MACGREPELFGEVTVHRFGMGQTKCLCGEIEVRPPDQRPKTSFGAHGGRRKKKSKDNDAG